MITAQTLVLATLIERSQIIPWANVKQKTFQGDRAIGGN